MPTDELSSAWLNSNVRIAQTDSLENLLHLKKKSVFVFIFESSYATVLKVFVAFKTKKRILHFSMVLLSTVKYIIHRHRYMHISGYDNDDFNRLYYSL